MKTTNHNEDATAGFIAKFLRALKKRWPLLIIFAFVGGLLGFGFSATQPRIYASDATGVVVVGNNESTALASAGDNVAKSKATQYQSLVTSRNVAARALDIADADISVDAAIGMVSAAVPLDTAQVQITVKSQDPGFAQTLADAWVQALSENVDAIESSNATGSIDSYSGATVANSTSVIKFISFVPANKPISPISPNVTLLIMLGGLLGLSICVVFIIISAIRDSRISSVESLREVTDETIIGTIPFSKSFSNGRIIRSNALSTRSRSSDFTLIEALKELRTNLQFMNPDNPPRRIVVTSSLPSDGKSTIADNLAITLSQSGQPVYLVDADLRRPTVAKSFGVVGEVGVTDVIIGKAQVDDVLQTNPDYPNLFILATGQIPPNPSELLSSDRFTNLIDSLADKGIVIMDAPPLLPVTDSAILSAKFDGAVVVVEAGGTKTEEIEKALSNLDRVKASVLGLVLNKVPTTGSEAGNYQYYGRDYYYSEDNTRMNQKKKQKFK